MCVVIVMTVRDILAFAWDIVNGYATHASLLTAMGG
jgi:hypothetical protein